jgi:hypothetical protein
MRSREWPSDERPAPDHVDISDEQGNDPVLTEAPATVLDDEDEVFDLGFIVEDRDDRRDTLHASWQRLDALDTDESLETGENLPLPQEAVYLEREGVPPSEYPSDARLQHAAAEMQEDDFATDNALVIDPYDAPLADNVQRDDPGADDLDADETPERVGMRGRAAGVVRGLGTSAPQDIGAGGFSVRDNPLSVPAASLSYPISTEPLSDAAVGERDVDEMGDDADLSRLADDGAALATDDPTESRRRRPSDPSPPEEPDAADPTPLDEPKPEMGLPQPVPMPELGESVPPGKGKRSGA